MTTEAKPIRQILYATDFSPASHAAFEHAERLAACSGADLLVLWNPMGRFILGKSFLQACLMKY